MQKLPRASDEYAQVVWASHILSYLNQHTGSTSERPLQLDPLRDVLAEDEDDDGDDFDDYPDTYTDVANDTPNLLAAYDEPIRQKFLNCIAELLAHIKGGKHVAATALREKEDSVEVDVASNSLFGIKDEECLASLSQFLGGCGRAICDAKDSCHSLLEATVIRNASRLDGWIQEVAKLLRDTLVLSAVTRPVGGACLFDCCRENQLPVSDAAEELIKQVQAFVSASATEQTATRLKIVLLAAVVVLSPEIAPAELRRIAPSVDGSKIARLCRLIARPAVNLRILARIAHLLPSFRAVAFIKVETPGSVRLSGKQIPGLEEAWKRLGLPYDHQLPRSLSRRERQFKRDCARAFPVHCEAQLLLRYENKPSLAPSLPYIGCSKKACFLCYSLLSVLALQARVRGHHGVCHPLWGVGPEQSENLRRRLRQLCDMIKEKIVVQLSPRKSRPRALLVPQSSAVSDLRMTDMVELRRQSISRERLERSNQEFRERMQILLHPRSTRPPASPFQGNLMCIMCQTDAGSLGGCKHCLSVSYCSKQCQSIDWPAHRLLCSSYLTFMQSRPSSLHKVGIWFPRDIEGPTLVWAPVTKYGSEYELSEPDEYYPEFDSFLGPEHGVIHAIPVTRNQRRGVHLGHDITVYYQPGDELPNKSLRHAAEVCHGMTVPGGLSGQLVAMAGRANTPPSETTDMTLSDFRHVLDFFSTRGDNGVREIPTGGTIRAVRISCELEQRLYGYDVFCAVFIQSDLPFANEQSFLSDGLGVPLRVCKPRLTDLEADSVDLLGAVQGGGLRNTYATALMTEINVSRENWGKSPAIFEGSAIIARSDRIDLDLDSAIRICRYCVEVLQPLFKRALAGEITQDDALREVSPRKLAAWPLNVVEDGDLV